jgi:predicted ATP-binding protein involved in virulence
MIVRRLQLSHLRGLREASLEFDSRMSLLVGVNGAGKSTILDALRILLSQVIPRISASRSRPVPFAAGDIAAGTEGLTAEIRVEVQGYPVTYSAVREAPARRRRGQWKPSVRSLLRATGPLRAQPLAVYFSPDRSLLQGAALGRYESESPLSLAFAKSLLPRGLPLQYFTDWWRAREAAASEGLGAARRQLEALDETVRTILEAEDAALRVELAPRGRPVLFVRKANTALDVRQLSDGERGVLALVLDLTRRLAQANPELANPARDGQAVVLIDELDLHLHPSWQRKIVRRLTQTFPNCQFIATSHSPQIISEVQPEELIFLEREGERITVRPGNQSYGLDTNWILEHLMGVPSRPEPARKLIDQTEEALEDGQLEAARQHLSALRGLLHGEDGEVVRLAASIDTLEALADAVDSEED